MASQRSVALENRVLSTLIRRHVNGLLSPLCDGSCGDKINRSQAMIISYLYENQSREMFQRDVEAHFRIRRSTATGVIQNMEKNGLIVRTPVDYDGRLKRLQLTDKAREGQKAFISALEQSEQDLRQGVEPEDLQTFFAVLDKMKKNLDPRGKEAAL